MIGILSSIITAKNILKPISETAQAAKAISAGDWNQELPTSSIKELNSLRQSFNTMARQLKKSFQDLEYAAYHDCLTGLPNQCSFRKTLEKTIADNKLTPNLFAVLFLDLDFFKFVNDSLGHLAGDVLLSEVARRLETCVRSNDIIARFGGDEFVILLNNTKSKNDAIAIIIRIQKELQKVFTINGNAVFINTSVGIVFSDLYPMSGEEMLKNADIALYQSKNNGKGMHTIFSKEMSLMSKNRLLLEMDLRQAMERKEIEIFYQPIFSIPEKDIVGFEALMRWRHPELGLIPPDIFIPIAEEIGLINSLGWWVAREACQQLKKWHEQFRECAGMKINVNFSGKQFFESNFIEQIQEILITTRLQPHNLSVEVTESIFIKYTDVMRDKLLELNRIGVKVSLDDFGVGYSCLSYLKDFSIDILKIDRSFTQNLAGNSKIVAIIEAIILLAAKLDVEIIAEGIETEEQLEMIQYLGCCQGQGYLFSRPLEARQCERLLKDFFQPFLNDDQFLPFRHNNQQSHQKANFQNY
ncbi:MAG: putative signaling protein [Chroococcopsis gigantea SAG 12.99]|nr:putative signaling protein [Chroococcopsis gigantea SAG 12.99]